MNNYCRNCGEKLEKNSDTCPKCNAKVFETRINVIEKNIELEKYKKKENKYIILIITLYIVSFVFSYISNNFELGAKLISNISPLFYLSATITLIYARITINDSKKIKIMFNIFITLIVLRIVFIIFILITCTNVLGRRCY